MIDAENTTSVEIDLGIKEGLKLLHKDCVFEVRVLDCPDRLGGTFKRTLVGYFSDAAAAEAAITVVERLQPGAIYVTLNPVHQDCLARCSHRLAAKIPSATDEDIVKRNWIFIDIDAKRKSGISSTDTELAAAKAVAKEVDAYIRWKFGIVPMVATSGNGWHLLCQCDLQNDDTTKKKIESLLKILASKFDCGEAVIDTSVFNAARITRVYGTVARKGENTAERPHRKSRIVHLPDGIIGEAALDLFLEEEMPLGLHGSYGSTQYTFDLENWISARGIGISSRIRTANSTKYYFADKPPLCGDHEWKPRCKDAYIELKDGGQIIAKCSHNRCGWTWQDYRQYYEPGCYDRKEHISAEHLDVDFSALLVSTSKETVPDEVFALDHVPATGLMRDVFNHYLKIANKPNPVLGLAVAVCLAETVIGRKVIGHTGRSDDISARGAVVVPNDYNVVIAPSGAGKQAVLDTMKQIFNAAESHGLVIPDDIKSDSALVKIVAEKKAGVWICDEVGRVLTSIFDSRESSHRTQIGTRLLTYYTDSSGSFEGCLSVAGGTFGRVVRPFLTLMGCTTQDSLFGSALGQRELSEGHINRFAFWCISEGSEPVTPIGGDVDAHLAELVKRWHQFRQVFMSTEDGEPEEYAIRFSQEACLLWEQYRDKIAARSKTEFENRAVIWQRVAHRAAKLALAHRCSRLAGPEELNEFSNVCVEAVDVQWAMELATWLARVTCDLVEGTIQDLRLGKLEAKIREVLLSSGPMTVRELCRRCRAHAGNNVRATLLAMQSKNVVEVYDAKGQSGRTTEWVRLMSQSAK